MRNIIDTSSRGEIPVDVNLALARIASLQETLEPYSSFAPEGMTAIRELEATKELLKKPAKDSVKTALDKLKPIERGAEPYMKEFPDIVSGILKRIAEIRECLS